ncbi:ABC transporter ATP-binding protein [Anaerosporobacter faecicola]|uniref:ABC transporter ATP-binding protein n=1 Tax=Anaerosporobacter faecicola TaxID=2718714 RepID=UPI00143C1BD7|nr:ABC transporter ATP-binding protein [Anaerosporobacter faecicola]
MKQYVLSTENVTKSFQNTEILHDINLSIEQGEVYGLIGENGAGKTTLLRVLSGLMKPTKGSIQLKVQKPYIGYMPQSCRFDDGLTVEETIRFFTKLRNADMKESFVLLDVLKLEGRKKVKHLSPGQQKKLQIVIAMAGNPDFYILDEPTAGLDPMATVEIKRIIKNIHMKGKSILISSHILQDMDEICTNIAILDKGYLTYNKEIHPYYMFTTSIISQEVVNELLQEDWKTGTAEAISVDVYRTTLTAHISREQVPTLVARLCECKVHIYEVKESNISQLVQEQLHIKEV